MLYIGFGICGCLADAYLVTGRSCGGPHGGEHDSRRRLDEAGRLWDSKAGDDHLPRRSVRAQLMSLLATVGIVYGVSVGLAQTDLKFVIGYSSVSHMGIVGLGLSTMTVNGINGSGLPDVCPRSDDGSPSFRGWLRLR